MDPKQGDLSLLVHPLAQQLLQSRIPGRLAYIALDATPRVVPVTFHWTGHEVVVTTWPDAPKVAALRARPTVALTIDTNEFPFNVLTIRGPVFVEVVDGLPPDYELACERCMGAEAGRAWAAQVEQMFPRNARIAIRPEWIGLLDYRNRFPSGIARAMAQARMPTQIIPS